MPSAGRRAANVARTAISLASSRRRPRRRRAGRSGRVLPWTHQRKGCRRGPPGAPPGGARAVFPVAARTLLLSTTAQKVPGQTVEDPLHRTVSSVRNDKNRFEAVKQCKRYWGQNYASGGKECDEYPFASTYEGAAEHGRRLHRVAQRVRAIRLLQHGVGNRLVQPAVVGLSGELQHPARHRDGHPVHGQLLYERVDPLPGRCACDR
ncbi:NucA/NucB deoxyribonuclease domain-containing protein [Streptomyces naganishii]